MNIHIHGKPDIHAKIWQFCQNFPNFITMATRVGQCKSWMSPLTLRTLNLMQKC